MICKAHAPSIKRIREALKYFHEVSGLEVNADKTRIYFGRVEGGKKDELVV